MQTVLFLDLFLEVGRRKLESQGSWKSADVFPCHKKKKHMLVLKPLEHNIRKILGRLHQMISVFYWPYPSEAKIAPER